MYAKLIPSILILLTVFISGCGATLPPNNGRHSSLVLPDTDDTRIGRLVKNDRKNHPGQSGFLLLKDGLEAYVARAVMADLAERSIDMQYYIYRADQTGKFLSYHLLEAADRGVRIRILVDDIDMDGRDMNLAALDAHPNIEIRIFNPFSRKSPRFTQFLSRFGSVTRRMHNKSFIIDNQAVIVGGRNIGDEYFDADPEITFTDLDVLAFGPVAADASNIFDLYWNFELSYPVGSLTTEKPTDRERRELRNSLNRFVQSKQSSEYPLAMRASALADQLHNLNMPLHWATADVFFDYPEKIRNDPEPSDLCLAAQISSLFRDLNSELIIFSPYFIPGEEGVAFFENLVNQGVKVRILTNTLSSTDVSIAHAGYAKYRKALLSGGIELYEFDKNQAGIRKNHKKTSTASLHAKSFVLDRKSLFVGSLNLDPRSFMQNTEIGIVIHSPELASGMAEWFDENIGSKAFRLELYQSDQGADHIRWIRQEKNQTLTVDQEPYSSIWERLAVEILGLLPIESQL